MRVTRGRESNKILAIKKHMFLQAIFFHVVVSIFFYDPLSHLSHNYHQILKRNNATQIYGRPLETSKKETRY